MPRILAVADEIAEVLYGRRLKEIAPDLIVSCGDLPFEYLEYLLTMASVPLLYVPGNHDPAVRVRPPAALSGEGLQQHVTPGALVRAAFRPPPGPQGGINLDGRIERAAGLCLAGLGGSIRYAEGPNRYSQEEMQRRALWLEARARVRRAIRRGRVDVLVTHSPPLGMGDVPDDPAHTGFAAFRRLITSLRPRLAVHGHVHPYGEERADRRLAGTVLVNVVPYRVLELGRSGSVDLSPEEPA